MVPSRILLSLIAIVSLGISAAPAGAQEVDDYCFAFPDDPTCSGGYDSFDDDPAADDYCVSFPDDPYCGADATPPIDDTYFEEPPPFEDYCTTYPDDITCGPDFDPGAEDALIFSAPTDETFLDDDYCATAPGDPFCDPSFDPSTDDYCATAPGDPFCDPSFDPSTDDYCVSFPEDPYCDPTFGFGDDGFLAPGLDTEYFGDYCRTFADDPICDPEFDPTTDDYCVTFADDPICTDPESFADEGWDAADSASACGADPFSPGCPLDPCLYDTCGAEAVTTTPQAGDAPQPAAEGDLVATIAARYSAQSDADLIVSLQNHLLIEIDVLTGLSAFAPVPPQFRAIADHTDEMPRFALLRRLPLVETAGTLLLAEIDQRGIDVSPAVRETLGELAVESRFALQDGTEGILEPATHVTALSDTIYRDGRSSASGEATLPLDEVEALLASLGGDSAQPTPVADNTEVAAPAPSEGDDVPEPTVDDDDVPDELALVEPTGGGLGTLPIVVGAASAVAIGGVGLGVRRRRQDGNGPETPRVAALLDASRRLANTLDETEVATIAVNEAMSLVEGEVGAFLATSPDGLHVLAEQPTGLVTPEGLDRSLLARIAETGQPVHAVTTSDTALEDVPLALAAVPVVCNGTVTGVLLVGRSSTRAFDSSNVERVEILAPMVGSALSAAMDHRSVAELVSTDGLTGLRNRRALDADLAEATTDNAAACFVMIDVDHFKTYNDTHGHAAGDTALKQVAAILSATVRDVDRVYRYGGEEFSVIVPGADLDIARDVAERIRAAIEAAPFDGEDQQPEGKVTVSLGLACAQPTETASDIIERADGALYEAKNGGRNRVQVAD